jgi:hypothetical protein
MGVGWWRCDVALRDDSHQWTRQSRPTSDSLTRLCRRVLRMPQLRVPLPPHPSTLAPRWSIVYAMLRKLSTGLIGVAQVRGREHSAGLLTRRAHWTEHRCSHRTRVSLCVRLCLAV